MTFTIAVTGSVASGKSTVMEFFANKGIPIINADTINRSLLEPNTPTFSQIVNHFGTIVVTEQGQLDRKQLREIIFTNIEEKHWLENLLHPIIREKILQQVIDAEGPYVIVEIPLLKSRQDFPYIQRVLLIDVNKDTQIKRLIKRDNCDNNQAEAIIRNHPPFLQKKKLADDIIYNNGTKDELFNQLEPLHKLYTDLAKTE